MCLNLARAFALHWKVYLICDFCRNLLCKLSFWCFCEVMVLYISRSKISNLTATWRHMRQGGYFSGVNILWVYQLSTLQWCCNAVSRYSVEDIVMFDFATQPMLYILRQFSPSLFEMLHALLLAWSDQLYSGWMLGLKEVGCYGRMALISFFSLRQGAHTAYLCVRQNKSPCRASYSDLTDLLKSYSRAAMIGNCRQE